MYNLRYPRSGTAAGRHAARRRASSVSSTRRSSFRSWPRLCGNGVAEGATGQVSSVCVRSERSAEAPSSAQQSHRLDHPGHAEQFEHALEVIGEHMQAHLGGHVLQPPRQEVR